MIKKNKGRQKIEMVKMKNESNLQVTFSKRRSGLFKKASGLCTLCDAKVALIVFSPGRKVYSFGHPEVETVIDRFLNNNPPLPHQQDNIQPSEAHRNSVIRERNEELTKVMNEFELEKKKNEKLKKIRENSKMAQNWWKDGFEGFNLSQCTEFKCKLEKLKKEIAVEASKFFQENLPSNFYMGSSSAFGIDGGSNINLDLDLSGQRRMVNVNAFINNQNMTLPNTPLQYGNGGNGNGTERLVPDYNMNEFNQNEN